ncbi:DNA-binding transcriptional regulator, AcrR family [Nakamurella panacisegetis]|uniref:DNA-binding transcriptional regulator, AcrR family n=1 Tax=Nakamurella panacisegetis TaxID=1090615 RepID=A0A1H0T8G0_9ACTN|nr:TetR/AcrR family transcriptional regulator [Nakamurella panacisegetis]SDP49878.1 DNA-binding transcriptional regulator, AcrR family [Nakamurella panacisegetis]
MTTAARADASARPLRADAERNRRLILEVAADVFAEKGLDAGFDEIARRAGVGAGTVYRRFPHRDELIEALLTHRLGELTELARVSAQNPDAWAGLVDFLEGSIAMQMHDRGLRELMEMSGRWADCSIEAKNKLVPAVAALLTRAKEQGQLRPDVELTDFSVLGTIVGSVNELAPPDLWRRYLVLFLDGLRTRRTAPTPLPVAAPDEDIYRAGGSNGLGGASGSGG